MQYYETLDPEAEKKLAGQNWTTKPCAICKKPTAVLKSHTGKTWDMEHGGHWRKEGGR